uniref:Uncharacterized protein n=1 Tax=Trichogramma kaykai TaxID=54128 RepID=A0ABD2X3K4_9HYME
MYTRGGICKKTKSKVWSSMCSKEIYDRYTAGEEIVTQAPTIADLARANEESDKNAYIPRKKKCSWSSTSSRHSTCTHTRTYIHTSNRIRLEFVRASSPATDVHGHDFCNRRDDTILGYVITI